MSEKLCVCGCGQAVVPPSMYAGKDDPERAKHRQQAHRNKAKASQHEQEQLASAQALVQDLLTGDDIADLLPTYQSHLKTVNAMGVLLCDAVGRLTPHAVTERVSQESLAQRERADALEMELQAVRLRLRQAEAAGAAALARAEQADKDAGSLAAQLDDVQQREVLLRDEFDDATKALGQAQAAAEAERDRRSRLERAVKDLVQEGLQSAGQRHARLLGLLNHLDDEQAAQSDPSSAARQHVPDAT